MLTALDRLTVYAILCFISLFALCLGETTQLSLMTLSGVFASSLGLWLEMRG